MGKKSKANRKKPPVATAAAAAAATATATATAATTATTATATATATVTKRGEFPVAPPSGEFPVSTLFIKAQAFRKKGNHAKAQKIYLQGIENGCVHCLSEYTMTIFNPGATIENRAAGKFCKDNTNLYLVLPLALEGAIRGNQLAIKLVYGTYDQVQREKKDSLSNTNDTQNPLSRISPFERSRFGDRRPTTLLALYWNKFSLKNMNRDDRTQCKQEREGVKKLRSTHCAVCGAKEDLETVTLRKCDGCHLYFYCSKECQKKMWQEGQHAGVCRQLGILQQYHKPFAKKIWTDIAVHGIAPKDIPELQELRLRMGLSRPPGDYQDQDLLEAVRAGRLEPAQLILPRKDGTVQIGSFPRPI